MNLDSRSLSRLIFLISSLVLLTALAFEHIGGLQPCPLCLQQRYAYYFVIPVSFACYLISRDTNKATLFKYGILACGAAMLANTALGSYHAGVEWGLWSGPDTCSGAATGELSPSFSENPIVSCSDAVWRFMGISMAGYNAIISLVIFTLASFASCNPSTCKN